LVGIILLAINLRTAVAAMSPVLDLIGLDVPIDNVGVGILGMLPLLAFGISGVIAPLIARRLGLEATLVLASSAMVLGPLVRALAGNYPQLVIGSVVALGGMGFANILLPPVVKKYFPDRISLISTLYVTLLGVSIATPPFLAAPVSAVYGWRISVGGWALVAVGALVPWLVLFARARRRAKRLRDDGAIPVPSADIVGRLWRSRVVWALSLLFVVNSLTCYAVLAWFPLLMLDTADMSGAQSGALLGLFGLTALPVALVIPGLAARMHNVGTLIFVSVGLFVSGFLGMLLSPASLPWLWILLVGVGSIHLPLVLVLINLRTRTTEGSIAVSGFVQAVGYGAGALGPLVVGLLHEASGGWTVPLIFLLAVSLAPLIAAVMLARPQFVEDELSQTTGSGDQLGPVDERAGTDQGPVSR
jgi:CP family cyanate transporter-like MFS transporter